jgi:thioredoxin reductase
MKLYNTVIVGAGASGILAAIYLNDSNSLLLEKNDIKNIDPINIIR